MFLILFVDKLNKMPEKIKKIKFIVFIVIVVFIFIIGGIIGYLFNEFRIQRQLFPSPNFEKIKGIPNFTFRNNLSCQILYSTDKEEIGKQISFLNLFSDNPSVLFSTGYTLPMHKVYETESVLTMVLIASGSGSIDAFVLDKKTGIFARVSAGSFLGVYSVASKGKCQ